MPRHPIPFLATLSLFLALSSAQSAGAKDIRVSLLIDASENIKAEVLHSVSRELAKFDDVVIGFADVDYQISVVALILAPCGTESATGNSNQQGPLDSAMTGPLYAISLVVAKSPPGVRSNPAQFSAILGHTIQTDQHLEALCKYVATETNAHVFEPERKARKTSRETTPTPR
jgi:hypothetical protein